MDDIVNQFYKVARSIPHAEEKALAYYLVREILEDLHADGKITEGSLLLDRIHKCI